MDVQRVWEEYGSQLRSFLVSKMPTPDDAEDLLQEILIKTHNNLANLKEPEKFKSWLYQIARNTITDFYRKQGAKVLGPGLPELGTFLSEDTNPQDPVFSELTQCLTPFLLRLPEKYRQAIEATDLVGQSQKDFAEELGLAHSTVKSRVQRGRAMLSDLFHECCAYQLDARGRIVDYKAGAECC